ncbi:MAG: aldose epimerase family protein [Bacteroidaceae bacterium]
MNDTKRTNLSGLNPEDFTKDIKGKKTALYILKNKNGMEVAVTNYGAAVLSIVVPDKNNQFASVILSHSDIDSVINSPEPFLSTTIGRYANRIAKGKFTLDSKTYTLATNNGANHLHGGPTGFHTRVWDAEQVNETTLELRYTSKDGEEGFPGKVNVILTYEVEKDRNAFRINYKAKTDRTTIINLTNHGFFNLAGIANPSTSVEDNVVTINADYYTPVDETCIPTGEIAPVEGTPMDFRTPHVVGERIDSDFEQLKIGIGYDHNYVLCKSEMGALEEAATCYDPKSGRLMRVYTTEPGVQLYTGNWLNGFEGAHGATYPKRSAICFEAQKFPDTPNKPHFPSAKLSPGEIYKQTTIYAFEVKE